MALGQASKCRIAFTKEVYPVPRSTYKPWHVNVTVGVIIDAGSPVARYNVT